MMADMPGADMTTAANDTEWIYEMRRVMQEILPKLWLGPYASGKKRDELREKNITHIMIVRSAKERIIAAKYPEDFKYHIVEILDVPHVSLLPYLGECKRFLDEGRANGGVLVHCDSGISRSAAVVIAYVMHELRMTYDQAFQYVSDRRCCVHPNLGFMHQLSEYEHMSQLLGQQAQPQANGRKRQLEYESMLDDEDGVGDGGSAMQEDV